MHLIVRGLYKSFGKLQVLRGVDLEIPPGQVCVIVGGSGSGKSVLLKHLVGLLTPDKGEILIDGRDISHLSESELFPYRRRFGLIFQSGGMLQSLSVGDNVGLALKELYGERGSGLRDVVAEKLRMVGMEGREGQMPATLSGGQRKRAAIARALTTKADCLLFDEPTAGLDPPISKTIDDLIVRVNKETGATTVVVTHDLVSVFGIADMVHMLYDGQVIVSATPSEFRKSQDERVRRFLARELGP